MASTYDFYISFNNQALNVVINVHPGSEYRMRSDALDGFNTMTGEINVANYAHKRGAALLGSSFGSIERTVTIYAPRAQSGKLSTGYRSNLRKCFSPGSSVIVTMCRYRGTSTSYYRQATAYVKTMKMNEGNIYEPSYVTATLVFPEPAWKATSQQTAYGSRSSASTTSVLARAGFIPQGELPTDLTNANFTFVTANTAAVQLTSAVTATFTITRPSSMSAAYNFPQVTKVVWTVFSSSATITANKTISISVDWSQGYPRAVIIGSSRPFTAIDHSKSLNIFHREIVPGKQNTVDMTLAIPSGQLGTPTVSTCNCTYMPLFLGE